MSYLANIPQSTDQLSVSQGNILNNFQVLGAIAGNTNPASASINATSGFNWVYLPAQGATPPAGAAFPANNVGIYSAPFNNGTHTFNELFINSTKNSGLAQIPMTAASDYNSGAPGFTYLPSGLIIAFGNGTANLPGPATITFLRAFPNACLTVVAVPASNSATTGTIVVKANSFTTTTFQVFVSNASVSVQYIAIGW